jgi:hypothetical protein
LEVLRAKNAELSRAQVEWAVAIKLLVMRAPEQSASLLIDLPIDRLFDDADSETGSMKEALADSEKPTRTSSHEGVIARPGDSCRASARDKLTGCPIGAADLAPMDIDLELTKKDRAQCTQKELDQRRRQRNRVHAKRTRVRKKAQIEELQDTVNEVNVLLLGRCNARTDSVVPPLCGYFVMTPFRTLPVQLQQTNQQLGDRIEWLCSKSFRVTCVEDAPPSAGNDDQ